MKDHPETPTHKALGGLAQQSADPDIDLFRTMALFAPIVGLAPETQYTTAFPDACANRIDHDFLASWACHFFSIS